MCYPGPMMVNSVIKPEWMCLLWYGRRQLLSLKVVTNLAANLSRKPLKRLPKRRKVKKPSICCKLDATILILFLESKGA